MLNCHNATLLMSQARERRLGMRERLSLRVHTMLCGACARFGQQLPLLTAAARRFAGQKDRDDV